MPTTKSALERQLEGQGWLPPGRDATRSSSKSLNRRVLSSDQQRREAAQRDEAEREAALEDLRRSAAHSRAAAEVAKPFPWAAVLAWSVGLLILVVPAIVVVARENHRTEVLAQEKLSNADLACTDGDVSARNSENLWTWLTGGADFRCENWETRDSRKQRERDLAEERWKAREDARRQR